MGVKRLLIFSTVSIGIFKAVDNIRPKAKAASEISLEHASKLLGHTDQEITSKVYRRVGEVVKPTK